MRAGSFAVLAIGAGLGACAVEPPRARLEQGVIGGSPTPEDEFPGVGALYSIEFATASCTGSLIAPDVVLTAAHCVAPAMIGPTIPGFTLAHDTVERPPTFVAGTRVLPHPEFDGTLPPSGLGEAHDVGLLFLAEPIVDVAPIPLPTTAEIAALAPGMMLDLVGYGITALETTEIGVMYDGRAPLISLGASELQISNPGDVQNCFGDSGGPALVDLGGGTRVVGVVSRSFEGTECTQGGIDTRVDAYAAWIEAESGVCAVDEPGCDWDGDGGGGDGGGCAATRGGAGHGFLVGLALVALARPRRRRRRPS